MKNRRTFWIFLFFIPVLSYSQRNKIQIIDSTLLQVPYKNGQVVYEKVIIIDSFNNKQTLFNAVKSTLIKSVNYKYSKIDEDRLSGNISTEITFLFTGKPGIAKLIYTGKSILSIDVKENRYRVQIFNNTATTDVLGVTLDLSLNQSLPFELEQFNNGKWKSTKSVVLDWHKKLELILTGLSLIVKENIGNDEF